MIPPSGVADERLARLWVVEGDPDASRELLRRYLPLARALARRYAYTSEPQEDLQQVAYAGFLAALARYDPKRGSTLRAYAIPTMLGELRRHFRDKAWSVRVPRVLQERSQKVRKTVDDLTRSQGRSPTIDEIGRAAGLTGEEVIEALEVSRAYRADSLDGPPDDTDADFRPTEPVYDDEGFGYAENRVLLDRALRALPLRERAIVELRFQRDMSQSEIGSLLGISQMHVSRLLDRALRRLERVLDHVEVSPSV